MRSLQNVERLGSLGIGDKQRSIGDGVSLINQPGGTNCPETEDKGRGPCLWLFPGSLAADHVITVQPHSGLGVLLLNRLR